MKINLESLKKFKFKGIDAESILRWLNKISPLYILVPLILAFFVWAIVLFYIYEIKSPGPLNRSGQTEIKKDLYNQVLNRMNQRKTDLKEGIEKNHRDIFR